MKTSALLLALGWGVGLLPAAPVDNIVIAAMRLSEESNYTWVTTASDDHGVFSIEGRTEPSGLTWLKLPVVRGIARELGMEDAPYLEALYAGRIPALLRGADGWVPMNALQWDRPGPGVDTFASARAGAPRGRMGTLGGPRPVRTRTSAWSRRVERRLPGDLHLGLNAPHEELAVLVSSCTELEIEGATARGTLSPLGAQLLLTRGDDLGAEFVAAGGWFTLWLQDGRVQRYQLRLEATITQGRQSRALNVVSTTVLKDVGTTQLPVADELRAWSGQ